MRLLKFSMISYQSEVQSSIKIDPVFFGSFQDLFFGKFRVQKGSGADKDESQKGVTNHNIYCQCIFQLWATHHKTCDVRPAVMKSLEDLKTEYLDLYLMHTPMAFKVCIFHPSFPCSLFISQKDHRIVFNCGFQDDNNTYHSN